MRGIPRVLEETPPSNPGSWMPLDRVFYPCSHPEWQSQPSQLHAPQPFLWERPRKQDTFQDLPNTDSRGPAPAADPSLVLGGSWLVLLTLGTPKSRNAEPTTKENQNHHNSNGQKSNTPTCRTPSTTRDNNKDKNDDIWESKRHPQTPRN